MAISAALAPFRPLWTSSCSVFLYNRYQYQSANGNADSDIFFIFFGIQGFRRLVHPSKAWSSITSIVSARNTFFSDLQFWNMPSDILSKFEGRWIVCRLIQLEKAYSPILTTESGIYKSFSIRHSEKAYGGICFMPFERCTSSRDTHSRKLQPFSPHSEPSKNLRLLFPAKQLLLYSE